MVRKDLAILSGRRLVAGWPQAPEARRADGRTNDLTHTDDRPKGRPRVRSGPRPAQPAL